MIEELLPPEVASADAFTDPPPSDDDLFPAEEQAIARAVPKRRREFTTARLCARKAMAELGLPPCPVLPTKRGAPQWPEGVVGSMTHCDGYRAAALARAEQIAAIGLDTEPNGPLPDGVLPVVSLEPEREMLAALPVGDDPVHWDRLLFSAKESVFKVWYPLTRQELDFDEAHITVDPLAGTFTARLLVPGPRVAGRTVSTFEGRWLCRAGLVLTAITLPNPDSVA